MRRALAAGSVLVAVALLGVGFAAIAHARHRGADRTEEGRLLEGTATSPAAAQPLYGITLDSVTDIPAIVSGIAALPERPTTRVVFTWRGTTPTPPADYAAAVTSLDPVSNVMGELLDSSQAKAVSTVQYSADVENYLSVLGSSVNIWEIGNEVNGNWIGPYATAAAKIVAAYGDVAATGAKTALTLYANEYAANNCGDGTSELTPVQFSTQYVPPSVRDGLTYVFESYYPTQCSPVTFPTNAQVASEMEQLHALYPNALLGFGEVGTPTAATSATAATAARVLSWAYSLDPGLSYYVGGYFDWYAYEDVFTGSRLLAADLGPAFSAEAEALSSSPTSSTTTSPPSTSTTSPPSTSTTSPPSTSTTTPSVPSSLPPTSPTPAPSLPPPRSSTPNTSLAHAPQSSGYDMVGSDGGVFVFPTGHSGYYGSLPGDDIHVSDVVGMVPTPSGAGYFLVGSDGGVFAFGDAPYLGSLPEKGVLVSGIKAIVPTANDGGYFLVGSDGGVFAFGNAPFLGSLPGSGIRANNVIGIAATPTDEGYWLVTSTGRVYSFGDAKSFGSVTASSSPVSGIESTPDGGGYWVVSQNGGVYAFGDAGYFGSLPQSAVTPVGPVIGVVPTSDQVGYWLIGSDGGIFAYGDAPFEGSLPSLGLSVTNVVGAVPTSTG